MPTVSSVMMGKRLFWREFWLLWGPGVVTGATVAALVGIPTTPLATLLLLRNYAQKPLLLATEAIEIIVELAIAVGCGLLAAHRVGLGAPVVEKWLRSEPIEFQLRPLLVPSLLVGILVAVFSILPNLSVFHPNRELAHREAKRISESPAAANLAEKLERFSSGPLTLSSLTVSYLNGAIRGELISRLFLLSGIALILTRITGTPSGTASDEVLFSAVLAVAAINVIGYLAWQGAASRMIYSSLGVIKTVHDPFWVIILRGLLQTVPANIGFGWLYVRGGIESAIISAFVSSVVAHMLLVLVVVRLV